MSKKRHFASHQTWRLPNARRGPEKAPIWQRRKDNAIDFWLPRRPIEAKPARICSLFLALCRSRLAQQVRTLNRRREVERMVKVAFQTVFLYGQTTESGIPPGSNDSRRYPRIHLGYTGQGSTLIGRIAIVPVVDTCTRRYSAFRLLSLGVTFFCRDLYRLLAENTRPFATDGLGKCSTHSTIRATSSRTNTGRTHHAHALRPFRSIGNIRTYVSHAHAGAHRR